MSEPFLERLSRFTPDPGRLERDALLFAAGRGSVRTNRAWIGVAAMLACTQALSLLLLWPHPAPLPAGLPGPVATVPAAPAALEPLASEALASPGVWSARHNLLEMEIEDRPAGAVTFVDSGPPLRAFAPLPPSLLN